MTVHIDTFPTVGIKNSTFGLTSIVATSKSPFTGSMQVVAYPGRVWKGSVTFSATRREEARTIQAFMLKLRGQYGTFLYGDPDALALGHQGAGGTILVNGASQTGNTLTVDGMTVSSTIARQGDYFQIGTGAAARLHMFTEDLVSDGSGEGTATFEPNLRSSPADDLALNITSPKGAFRLESNDDMWESNENSVYNMSFNFVEAL